MFRGTFKAKIDEKERLKMPAAFRKLLADEYGDDIFITSLDGEKALLYPLKVWNEMEERLSRLPRMNPRKERMLRVTNYYGLQSSLDGQGRTSLPSTLKEKANLNGEVIVMGMQDHFEIWNHEKFQEDMSKKPFTEDDMEILSKDGF
jgi:MraZ protein